MFGSGLVIGRRIARARLWATAENRRNWVKSNPIIGWQTIAADLLNLLHVLGRLVALEPEQAMLLETICDGELLSATEITSSDIGAAKARKSTTPITGLLL